MTNFNSVNFKSRKNRSSYLYLKNLIVLALYAHLLVNIAITSGFLFVSKMNYPGANALVKLHELEPKDSRKSNYCAF